LGINFAYRHTGIQRRILMNKLDAQADKYLQNFIDKTNEIDYLKSGYTPDITLLQASFLEKGILQVEAVLDD